MPDPTEPNDPNTPNEPTPPPESGGGGTPLYAANEKITKINVADEIKNSFLDYSMSVIISRALPDVRDGLKPSQRRILYAMNDLGVMPNRKHIKCAKIVGETMGNYHPHGDQAIYPTLVHMAQPWAMRERLVDGQGNFGSVEGDPPAAMRYTEARLTHRWARCSWRTWTRTPSISSPITTKRTTEPTVFPAAFPNLLVNGGTGIAVGMATNMPPHNLGEIIDGVCAQIDNPNITVKDLMKFVKGPDFPTGCMVCGLEGDQGLFQYRPRQPESARQSRVWSNSRAAANKSSSRRFPYNVNRAVLVERIAELVNEKIITDITAVRDESDENTRVVIEIKRDAHPQGRHQQSLQAHALETSFAVNALAIDHGRPKTLKLKEIINCYIEHRREVIMRRTRSNCGKPKNGRRRWKAT